jgi:hypothetical protein
MIALTPIAAESAPVLAALGRSDLMEGISADVDRTRYAPVDQARALLVDMRHVNLDDFPSPPPGRPR